MATENGTFSYQPTTSGTYTWNFRMKNNGMVAQPASVCYLDNLQVSYPYPYTRIDCDKGPNASYRYGFNGKEDDKEIEGQQDYGMRIYDNRIARFKSVDPLAKKYSMLTPYQFASNSPISGIDLDGLEYYYAADGSFLWKFGTSTQVMLVNDDFVKENKGKNVSVKDLNDNSVSVGMTNEELNTRAFMATLKETENGGNEALPYNAKHGFTNGKLSTFTDKTYEEAPKDYKNHPYANSKKGGTAAGAYQMLKGTFKSQLKNNPLVTDFGPNSQDNAVIGVFKGVDALESIKKGKFKLAIQTLTKDKWGNTQFASLPGGGQEASGMSLQKVLDMIKSNISKELQGQSNVSLPVGQTLPAQ